MDTILDALRTALVSYRDELMQNEREATNASEYLHTLGKRRLFLEGQIAKMEAEIVTRKEELNAQGPHD